MYKISYPAVFFKMKTLLRTILIPGCLTEGKTLEEAYSIKALGLYLDTSKDIYNNNLKNQVN